MNQQVPMNYNYDEDEIDLKELLAIIVKEKKVVFITFFIVFILSLIGAFYVRSNSKEAATILQVDNSGKYGNIDLLPDSVLEKLYTENKIKEKEKLSLDEFKNRFEIEGIIPKSIKTKQEFLEKKGESLQFVPTYYVVKLKCGSAKESLDILEDYYKNLNADLQYKNESRYRFKKMDLSMLNNQNYDYQDYLDVINERKKVIKKDMEEKSKEKLDYVSYGFGYRDALNEIVNLEEIDMNELQNFLDSTKIVKNLENFKDSYANRKETLQNELALNIRKEKDYKNILSSLKPADEDMSVPQGMKVELSDNPRDVYYTKVMNEYLDIENNIEELKNKMERLDEKNNGAKTPSVEEEKYIQNSLKNIFNNYNGIINLINTLEIQENTIEYGEIVEKMSPVVIVSNSKAKLIVAVGLVMGIFMGVIMAFVKNFFKDFKKYLPVIFVFFLVGINSYSKEEITFVFSHKEMKKNQNPDKTPFNLKNEIDNFLNSDEDSKIVSVEAITDEDGYLNVKSKLENDKMEKYIPTEYLVTVEGKNEKEIAKKLKEQFPNYYINRFFQANRYGIVTDNSQRNYRQRLEVANNRLNSINDYIENRKIQGITREKFNEFRNMQLEIWRINNTELRDLKTYLNSKKIVSDINLETILLTGEKENLERELKNKEEKAKFYDDILKTYSLNKGNKATILKDGDIAITNKDSKKEKQFIEISNKYAEILNSINSLKKKLVENENLSKNMKVATDDEKVKINKEFEQLEKDINDLNENMKNIELRDYRREYLGTVKVY